MPLRKYYKKERQKQINVFLIILGLLVIFVIGYVFWHSQNKNKKIEGQPASEPNTLEKLKSLLSKKNAEKLEKENRLETKVVRRKQLFLYTRFILVLLMFLIFVLLQFVWTTELFKKSHWFDNLRNYVTTIILGFTTVAFVSKGSLKTFKESIEEMAISYFFKDEETLKDEIATLELEIESIEKHIKKIEQ